MITKSPTKDLQTQISELQAVLDSPISVGSIATRSIKQKLDELQKEIVKSNG